MGSLMNPNWLTINTKSNLIVQINVDTVVIKDDGELSVDTMVYTMDGSLVENGNYDEEVETSISDFVHEILKEEMEK
ncbi:MAG: hypothetical protein HOK95_06040 [Candidatus Marinimicrobia bacterium]|nr:hypothetical protein [Candidatus Neomarinimicrobiota bacterium]